VWRKLLSTLRVENSATYGSHGADLVQCGYAQREISGYTALAQGVRWTQRSRHEDGILSAAENAPATDTVTPVLSGASSASASGALSYSLMSRRWVKHRATAPQPGEPSSANRLVGSARAVWPQREAAPGTNEVELHNHMLIAVWTDRSEACGDEIDLQITASKRFAACPNQETNMAAAGPVYVAFAFSFARRASAVFIAAAPSLIMVPIGAAASSGSTSAIHTTRLPPTSRGNTCTAPL
jgi:hypothetical protein